MLMREMRQVMIMPIAIQRDWLNRKKFGARAPRFAELIWINPASIEHYLSPLPNGISSRTASALVIDFRAAAVSYQPLHQRPQVQSCYQHWRSGVPWEETEDYARALSRVKLLRLGLSRKSKSMVRRRYGQLDRVYDEIKNEGGFKTQKQLKYWNFREYGGVQVSVDRSGTLSLVRASGLHRISIAKILRLKYIPAQIGLVDIDALHHLDALRAFPGGTRS